MKTNFWKIAAMVLILAAGYYFLSSEAFSDQSSDFKVAVVDVQKIVSGSSAVRELRVQQERKINEMQAVIDRARDEIAREQDPEKIKTLEENYLGQINRQKAALDEEYNRRLDLINDEIKSAVSAKASAMGYNLVVPKNMSLYGGDDITEQVAASVR
jgi:Skp family chaperone for outer membrane proteins